MFFWGVGRLYVFVMKTLSEVVGKRFVDVFFYFSQLLTKICQKQVWYVHVKVIFKNQIFATFLQLWQPWEGLLKYVIFCAFTQEIGFYSVIINIFFLSSISQDHLFRMSNWRRQVTEGAEFWISCYGQKLLRKAGH